MVGKVLGLLCGVEGAVEFGNARNLGRGALKDNVGIAFGQVSKEVVRW